jgi:hypothetical protein
VVGGWWVITRRLPPPDRRPSLAVDAPSLNLPARPSRSYRQALDRAAAEKIALVSLVIIIFAQILPDVRATALQLSLGVAFLIVANTTISEWLARRGVGWSTAFRQFVAMAAVNAGVAVAAWLLLPVGDGSIHVGNALFFLLMLTLLITLYDRFRPYHVAREVETAAPSAQALSAH